MEHIVQFAIGIDDEKIKERVQQCAYNDVVTQLMTEAKKDLKLTNSYYRPDETWSSIVDRALRKYFDENKDLIIELAAAKLADSYKRSKAYKEAMAKAMEET